MRLMNAETEQTPLPQAARVIARFGGVRKLQRALGHPNPTTVQGWKERGWIPSKHHQRVLEVARENGIELSANDFIPEAQAA